MGYENCDEIRMPLSPVAMLILERRVSRSPVKVEARRFYAYNIDIALQCYEFAVCSPGRRARLDMAPMALNRPAVRFDTAPGSEWHLMDHTRRWATSSTAGFRCATDPSQESGE